MTPICESVIQINDVIYVICDFCIIIYFGYIDIYIYLYEDPGIENKKRQFY